MIIGINGYSGSGKDTIGTIIQYLNCDNPNTPLEEVLKDPLHNQWWLEDSSRWEVKKWAGKLKTIASLLTGISQERFEDQEFKKTNLGPEWDYWEVSLAKHTPAKKKPFVTEGRFITKQAAEIHKMVYSGQYGYGWEHEWRIEKHQMSVRQFLQELGTDACRNGLHPNTWVNALMADYVAIPEVGPGITEDNDYQYPNWIITDTRFPNEAQAIKDAGGIVIRVDRPGVSAINAHSSETSLDSWDFDYKIMNGSDITSLMFSVYTILKKQGIHANYQTKNQDVSHS
jgi:hypothetical protein